jgi:hypothetical protein
MLRPERKLKSSADGRNGTVKVMTATIYRDDLLYVAGYTGTYLHLPANADEMQDAKERARISKGKPYRVKDIVDNSGEEINYIPNDPPLAELNFFAQRLINMTDDDLLLLRACVKMEKSPPDMQRLINLTYNLQECAVASAVGNDEALGNFLVDSDMVDSMLNVPDEVLGYIDYAKIGKNHRESTNGVFLNGTYIENLADQFRTVYDGAHLAEQPAESFGVFRLLLQKGSLEPEKENSVWLALPAKQEDINSVLQELKAASLDNCVIVRSESTVPHFENQFAPYADIDKIIVLADRISSLKNTGLLPKYKAALDYTDCTDLDLAVDLAANLDCYDFSPEVYSAEDYGRQIFIEQYNIQPDNPDLKLIQLDRYGFEKMKLDGATNTDYGFVRRNEFPFFQEYMKADPTMQQMGSNMT